MDFRLLPVATQFRFNFSGKKNEQNKFYRELYGYTNYSNNSEYKYKRPGFLSEIPYLKTASSTIVVPVAFKNYLKSFFKKHGVTYNENTIVLDKKDAKELGIISSSTLKNMYEDLKGSENTLASVDF